MKKPTELQPGDFAITCFGGSAKKVRISARKEASKLDTVKYSFEPEIPNGPQWLAAPWFRYVDG